MSTIIDKLTDKRILIFGYGREGKSTENYIKAHVNYRSLDIFEGDKKDIDESKYDLIIKSPGIVMLEENPKYTSQTELFLNEFSFRTVGVTGTKGKSTTSSMLAHTLNTCGKNAILLGNIGKPCFDMIDEISDDTIIVFELSCHQLLHIEKAPHISVFLNLFEEHLDYYGSMDKYFAAKANIISHQNGEDVAYLGENVPEISSLSRKHAICEAKQDFELAIPGKHNELNAEFVYRIAVDEFGCEPDMVLQGLKTFKGLPHRLEFFDCVRGIRFYDDSISTIPEAAISAVESIEKVGTVILGGMDRGIDYDILVDYIKKTPEVSFIMAYATGERIYEETFQCSNVSRVEDLAAAVKEAFGITEEGMAVVLSPAAPSYGYFKNFEDRGECFKSLVRGYSESI